MSDPFFSTRKQRMRHVPTAESGRWLGERGNSVCKPHSGAARQILEAKGLSGIRYQDGKVDFSPVSESTVRIAKMTSARRAAGADSRDSGRTIYTHYNADGTTTTSHKADRNSMSDLFAKNAKPGNFDQADILTAQEWTRAGRGGREWNADDVRDYRSANGLTWHEDNDGETMMLVPQEINSDFGHLGGTAEMKMREEFLDEFYAENGSDATDDEVEMLSNMSEDEIDAYFKEKYVRQDQYGEKNLGITELQRENAKTYEAPLTKEGWPDHDGFVPDDTQILLDEIKDLQERDAVKAALNAPVEEEDFDGYEDTYTPEERAEIDEVINEIGDNEPEFDWDEHLVPAGMRLTRYTNREINSENKDMGRYLSTVGTDRSELSLKNAEAYTYRTDYEVIKPFNAKTGVAAAAFQEKGGGDQIVPTEGRSISWLEQHGYIRKVNRAVQQKDGSWKEYSVDPGKDFDMSDPETIDQDKAVDGNLGSEAPLLEGTEGMAEEASEAPLPEEGMEEAAEEALPEEEVEEDAEEALPEENVEETAEEALPEEEIEETAEEALPEEEVEETAEEALPEEEVEETAEEALPEEEIEETAEEALPEEEIEEASEEALPEEEVEEASEEALPEEEVEETAEEALSEDELEEASEEPLPEEEIGEASEEDLSEEEVEETAEEALPEEEVEETAEEALPEEEIEEASEEALPEEEVEKASEEALPEDELEEVSEEPLAEEEVEGTAEEALPEENVEENLEEALLEEEVEEASEEPLLEEEIEEASEGSLQEEELEETAEGALLEKELEEIEEEPLPEVDYSDDSSIDAEIPNEDYSDESFDGLDTDEGSFDEGAEFEEDYEQESLFGEPVDYSDSADSFDENETAEDVDFSDAGSEFADGAEQMSFEDVSGASYDGGDGDSIE